MKRRTFLQSLLAAGEALGAQQEGRLLAAGYVWQQWAGTNNKKLGDAVDEIFPATARSGFRHMELPSAYFSPDVREHSIEAIRKSGIDVPVLYHGGTLHERAAAEKTIAEALEFADAVKSLGVKAVNTNANPKAGRAPKSDGELAAQAAALNLFGEKLKDRGLRFFLHSHDPEMAQNAREWRYMLTHTDPKLVSLCADVHWLFRGGQDPYALLEEAGNRVASLHLRNSTNKIWSESFGDGDIDYRRVAAILRHSGVRPYLVVELAYEKETRPVRSLEDDLRESRTYTEKIFKVKA
ncbi:MAG TPA: TIM barrel protein [Bryobacteraceae bacterium]